MGSVSMGYDFHFQKVHGCRFEARVKSKKKKKKNKTNQKKLQALIIPKRQGLQGISCFSPLDNILRERREKELNEEGTVQSRITGESIGLAIFVDYSSDWISQRSLSDFLFSF